MPQSDPMIGHFGSRRAGASPPRTAARTPRLSEFHQTHTNKFGPGDSTSSPGPSQPCRVGVLAHRFDQIENPSEVDAGGGRVCPPYMLHALSLGLFGLGVDQATDPTAVMAGSMIMTIPVVLIFFLFQHYFIEGVTVRGMKG